jgi:uncharacterized protein involved in copper resistance
MIVRTLGLAIAVCLILGTAQGQQQPTQAQQPAAWKEFTSKEGHFKVMMPGTPKEMKSKIPGAKGEIIDLTMDMVDAGKFVHVVAYQDNAQAAANAEQEKQALTIARNAIAARFQGKILSTKDVKLADKYDGMEVQIEVPQLNGIYRSRLYLVGKRLYHVTVIGPKELTAGKESDNYLDSFKVTN